MLYTSRLSFYMKYKFFFSIQIFPHVTIDLGESYMVNIIRFWSRESLHDYGESFRQRKGMSLSYVNITTGPYYQSLRTEVNQIECTKGISKSLAISPESSTLTQTKPRNSNNLGRIHLRQIYWDEPIWDESSWDEACCSFIFKLFHSYVYVHKL